jgi:hypothetical protein
VTRRSLPDDFAGWRIQSLVKITYRRSLAFRNVLQFNQYRVEISGGRVRPTIARWKAVLSRRDGEAGSVFRIIGTFQEFSVKTSVSSAEFGQGADLDGADFFTQSVPATAEHFGSELGRYLHFQRDNIAASSRSTTSSTRRKPSAAASLIIRVLRSSRLDRCPCSGERQHTREPQSRPGGNPPFQSSVVECEGNIHGIPSFELCGNSRSHCGCLGFKAPKGSSNEIRGRTMCP